MKRLLAAALAAALVLTSAPAVSHAEGVTVQETDKAAYEAGQVVTIVEGNTELSVKKATDGTTTVTAVKDTKTKKTLKVVDTDNGISSFSASAFKGTKAKTIDLSGVKLVKLNKNQFKGSKAKTVKLNATKLTAKSINKKALKGSKIKKMVITAKSKKAFKALVKKLKKSGKNVTFVFKKAK